MANVRLFPIPVQQIPSSLRAACGILAIQVKQLNIMTIVTIPLLEQALAADLPVPLPPAFPVRQIAAEQELCVQEFGMTILRGADVVWEIKIAWGH